ncbi:hypothetical protein CTAM01_15961 [Colletotrichum tamarilloi]|uniref:Uncharacterized protein n=1 Tax=Colletotrichum tamarilloi TaxID=1209934 RepID=A0ABQ9QJZ7_9PEZI|nr:uncharacterized protein CTAM01_15961 [Colletotrichum tamarilloi]KAK1474213.1 hypothetical protein CTAM01_15961 [Colletotrichum tamarilloi]
MSPGIAYLTTSLTNHPRPIRTQVFGVHRPAVAFGPGFCTLYS